MNKTPIAQSLDLIRSPHPLNAILERAEKQIALRPGMTLREILMASDIDPHAEIVCTINGQPVRVAEWDTLVPVADDVIQVQAVVSGGGNQDDKDCGDCCSPFMNCHTCVGFTFPIANFALHSVLTYSDKKVSIYKDNTTSDFFSAIWQPPKIS